jgi:hypothetical protein
MVISSTPMMTHQSANGSGDDEGIGGTLPFSHRRASLGSAADGPTRTTTSPAAARRVAAAYARWGKGNHRAALNVGDCFAYEVAKHHACPLLYVGRDFARTDVRSAI